MDIELLTVTNSFVLRSPTARALAAKRHIKQLAKM